MKIHNMPNDDFYGNMGGWAIRDMAVIIAPTRSHQWGISLWDDRIQLTKRGKVREVVRS